MHMTYMGTKMDRALLIPQPIIEAFPSRNSFCLQPWRHRHTYIMQRATSQWYIINDHIVFPPILPTVVAVVPPPRSTPSAASNICREKAWL